MRLTKEKLLSLWRTREQIIKKDCNKYIIERYNTIKELFEEINSINVEYDDKSVSIGGEPIIFTNNNKPSLSYFSCMKDDKTASGAFEGVELQKESFPDKYKDLVIKIGCMLGGFDFQDNYRMVPEFRIISNTPKNGNDNATLISEGQVRHPSSHFADNNYFFNVIKTINDIKNDTFNPDKSKLVLRWPSHTYYPSESEAENSQREALKTRFPYKYFFMWTHDVLHPVGLMAYRNLVQQEDKSFRYIHDLNMDQPWADFISDNGWQQYSEAICKMIPLEEQGGNFLDEMSKLLSIVMIQDQEIRNIKELLESGNHAIILYGPPGTGKTYHAEELVCQELGISREQIEEYKFTNSEEIKTDGSWTLVQFHPNYTYEDFIGGISPNLNGSTLSYTLKEGIFKQFCDKAARKENESKKFLMVIDEINRADLSSVFGELMFALEYRGRSLSIPNFSGKFVIPSNVYLIGTMNSIDKSLVTFDLALRRRFAFYKCMPQLSVLESMLSEYRIEESDLYSFIERCKKLNDRIASPNSSLQLGVDYQIGHAYFGKLKDFLEKPKDENTVQKITSFELEKLWIYHLCPLLEEYLGNRIDDEEIRKCLNELKENFTKPL